MSSLSEIEELLSRSENSESRKNVQHHDESDQILDDDEVDKLLSVILNDMTKGNVSNLDTINPDIFGPPPPPPLLASQQTIPLPTHGSSTCSNMLTEELSCSTNTPTASGVTITFQLVEQAEPQVIFLARPLPAAENGVATPIPIQMVASATMSSVASSQNNSRQTVKKVEVPKAGPVKKVEVPTAGPSESRKRKLYEEDAFADPEMERKRQNAINAKRHRDARKQDVQVLQNEKQILQNEKEVLEKKNEELMNQIMHAIQVQKDIEELRKENEDLKQQLQAFQQQQQQEQNSLQQEKLGVSLFDFDFDF